MPFIQHEQIQRLSPPTDLPGISDGEWIDISITYTAGLRRKLFARSSKDGHVDEFAYREALLEEIVRAWSDPEPVSPDALKALNPRLLDWIVDQHTLLAFGRPEEEKKDSSGSSSPTSDQETALSPASSTTS